MTNCIYCNSQLPNKGFFCPQCSKQVKCKRCSEMLLAEAKVCIFCGEEVGLKTSSTNLNSIEFSETETSRNFKASFTDTVGQSISDSFGLILANKMGTRKNLPPALTNSSDNSQQVDTVDADVEIIDEPPLNNTNPKVSDIPTLEVVKLRDLAKTETDWFLVYAYYASAGGEKEFTRKDILKLYEDSGRLTEQRKKGLSQYVINITNALYIKSTNKTNFILLEKGKAKALKIFNGDSVPRTSIKRLSKSLSTTTPNTIVENNETSKSKKASSSVGFVDLELTLNDQKSLKDFFNDKKPQSQNENVLVAMKWYIDHKKIDEVSKEEINYLLSIISKPPSALPQVLGNMVGARFRWVAKGSKGKYKLSSIGEGHISKLPKTDK